MKWTPEQDELLADCVCLGSWSIDPENFLIAADLVRRGILSVGNGDEGSIRVFATEVGTALALKKKFAVRTQPYGRLEYGNQSPQIVKMNAERTRRSAAAKKARDSKRAASVLSSVPQIGST